MAIFLAKGEIVKHAKCPKKDGEKQTKEDESDDEEPTKTKKVLIEEKVRIR